MRLRIVARGGRHQLAGARVLPAAARPGAAHPRRRPRGVRRDGADPVPGAAGDQPFRPQPAAHGGPGQRGQRHAGHGLPPGRNRRRQPCGRSSPSVELARHGASFSTAVAGGVEVLVAVDGLPGGTAVIRSFVPDAELHHGVARAWLLLLAVGAFLLGPQRRRGRPAGPFPGPAADRGRAGRRAPGGGRSVRPGDGRGAAGGPPGGHRPQQARHAHRRPARQGAGIGRRPVAPAAHAADRAAHRRRVAARQQADRRRRHDGAHGQRDHPRGTAPARRGARDAVRREPGDRRARGVLAPARGRPGPPDERQRATGSGTRPGVPRRPRGLRGHPARERLHAHAGRRRPRRPGQPPGGRRRVACRVGRRAWLPARRPVRRGQSGGGLNRPRPGHRTPDRRGVRRHAGHRPVPVRWRPGRPQPGRPAGLRRASPPPLAGPV